MVTSTSRAILSSLVVLLSACATQPAPLPVMQTSLPQTVARLQDRSDIVGLVMDVDETIGARVREQDDYRILQWMSKDTGHWKSIYKWTQADSVWPLRTDRVRGTALLVSDVGRPHHALIELSLADGSERVIAADASTGSHSVRSSRPERGLKLSHELKR